MGSTMNIAFSFFYFTLAWRFQKATEWLDGTGLDWFHCIAGVDGWLDDRIDGQLYGSASCTIRYDFKRPVGVV